MATTSNRPNISASRSSSSIASSGGGASITNGTTNNGPSSRFATLLRSAGRKSSESLRSVRSSASGSNRRKSFNHPVPPLPTLQDSPIRSQHHQGPFPSDSSQQQPIAIISASNSFASRPGAATTSRPPDIITNNPREDEDDGARTPTANGATTPTQAEPYGRPMRSAAATSSASNSIRRQHPPKSAAGTSTFGGTREGDGNTVAQLYAVFGLPKDPSVWTLAEEDCVAGVHHTDGAVGRFWRPEVLGCSICPSPSELLNTSGSLSPEHAATIASQQAAAAAAAGSSSSSSANKGASSSNKDSKSSSNNPKYIEMADGRGRIEKTETARVLSKALKLSFTREIEIISGQNNYPPMASSHTFSFSVPTVSSSVATLDQRAAGSSSTDLRKGTGAVGVSHHKASAATGEGYGLEATRPTPHGSGLASANTAFDPNSTPATFYGVVITVWSAADEKRTKAIKRELNRAAKARTLAKDKRHNTKAGSSLEDEDGPGFLPANNAFFMPYAICIVSRYPLYDLLGDWNKWAWHKYSRNIEMHNKLMSTILSKPVPRLGEHFVVDSPDGDLAFSCTFPGALEWGTGLIGVDFTMWPLFKTLTVDDILTICEIALAPNGRVLFHSRYPALLGLAVETIKSLVEFRGWTGIANQNCHARDVKIYLEDPGSWIIAIATELKSITKPAKEVCVVDLDINFVHCPNPPPGAPSTKGLREKRRKKLYAALGFTSTGDFRPPREYVEAYPGGRFRPLSSIIARSNHLPYERLETPVWWNQSQVIAAFDKALNDGSRPSALSKLLRIKNGKNRVITESELAAILALRKRASTFVDARDGLENKIGRLNKRLAFLMSESEMWKAQFSKIQQLVDRLTREANDTRAKLEKERRESRRLSTSLAQRDMERMQLQVQLEETEKARTDAQAELSTMQRAMDSLEHEREAMMDEIRQIISGAGADELSVDMARFDLYNESVGHETGEGGAGGEGSSSRPSSSHGSHLSSMTPSQAADRILKSRKAAEDRINAGRPSSRSSRSRHGGGPPSSMGHESRRTHDENGTNLGGNHFPEDQMNYEIQKRTSSVTDQISRIQAQLENTLSHLEDRRGHRRRARRDSGGSYASGTSSAMRYEYRTPSSLGGGHSVAGGSHASGADGEPSIEGGGGGGGAAASVAGNTDSEFDYDSQSGYDSNASAAGMMVGRRRRRHGDGSSRRHRLAGQGPPSAYRGPSSGVGASGSNNSVGSASSGTSRREGNGSHAGVNGSTSSSRLLPRASKDQLLQEREQVNPWKAQQPTQAQTQGQPSSASSGVTPSTTSTSIDEAMTSQGSYASQLSNASENTPTSTAPSSADVGGSSVEAGEGHLLRESEGDKEARRPASDVPEEVTPSETGTPEVAQQEKLETTG